MSAAEKGLAIVAPQQSLTAGLTEAEWEYRKDLFRRLIVREGDPAKVDLALLICRQYGFDPILKHVVLINGSVYVTRDGLLHIAHASGQFDGIEVSLTQLHGGEWAATATVYRKDMTRPIRYTVFQGEHTPDKVDGKSAWGKYPRAMLAKCAEVAALRRAFDVSLGAVEELGYDGVAPSSSIGTVTVVEETPAELPAPEKSVEELAEAMLDWLAKTARNPKQIRYGVERMLALTEDQALHEAWLVTALDLYEDQESRDLIRRVATPLVHQDALDAAWFSVMPPAQEPDGGALQGDVPGDGA